MNNSIWNKKSERGTWLSYIEPPTRESILEGVIHELKTEIYKLTTKLNKTEKELDETKKELEEAKKGHSHEVGQVHLGLVVEGLEKAAEQIRDELLNKQALPISGVRDYNKELDESLRALLIIEHCLAWDMLSPGLQDLVHKYINKSRNEIKDKKIEEPELVAKIDREELAKMVIKVMKKKEV